MANEIPVDAILKDLKVKGNEEIVLIFKGFLGETYLMKIEGEGLSMEIEKKVLDKAKK